MFYPEMIDVLHTNQAIVDSVSKYNGEPAIFSNEAPEAAERPYIVIDIKSSFETSRVVSVSNLFIDYYDFNESRFVADQYARDLEDLLDHTILRTENITDLRISIENDGYIDETDPRSIHHNSTFSCRGARSGWMKRTKII